MKLTVPLVLSAALWAVPRNPPDLDSAVEIMA